MIQYTFKTNDEFYIFKDLFSDVYEQARQQIINIEKIKNSSESSRTVESKDGEDFLCLTQHWPDIDCFKDTVHIFANLCTAEMIDYLNNHPVKRYIVIVNESGQVLFPETQIPNLRGQEYIDWVEAILSA